jgi:hypothetical protein
MVNRQDKVLKSLIIFKLLNFIAEDFLGFVHGNVAALMLGSLRVCQMVDDPSDLLILIWIVRKHGGEEAFPISCDSPSRFAFINPHTSSRALLQGWCIGPQQLQRK